MDDPIIYDKPKKSEFVDKFYCWIGKLLFIF
jgi:hypothetical protein